MTATAGSRSPTPTSSTQRQGYKFHFYTASMSMTRVVRRPSCVVFPFFSRFVFPRAVKHTALMSSHITQPRTFTVI